MTHPLTPREMVARQAAEAFHNGYQTYDECDETMRMRFDWIADALVGSPALASGSGDHSGGVTDMIDHAELARLADMSACVIARHGRAPSLDDLPSDPENWSGFAHAKILAEHRATLLAENAALRARLETARFARIEHNRQFEEMRDRATEAERKLAGAVGLLTGVDGGAATQDWWRVKVRAFLSKEAERG